MKRLLPELANDLEPAAEAMEPRLAEFRAALEEAAGRPAIMAGSGSAYVVPMDRSRGLPDVAVDVGRRLRVPVVAAGTVTRGVRVG